MKKLKFFSSLALVSGVALLATSCDPKSNEPNEPKEVTLDITVPSIYAQSAIIEVTPSNDTVYYYANALATDTLNAYFATDAELIADDSAYFEDMIEFYQTYYQEELTLVDFLYQGKQKLTANSYLLPNTEYTAYAYQIDPKTGKALTGLTKKTFTTKESYTATNTISFTYTDDGVSIQTTDESPYFFYTYDKETWDAIAGDGTQATIAEYINMIVEKWASNGYTLPIFNGNMTIPYAEFEGYGLYIESGENVFVAAPFDGAVNGTIVSDTHTVTLSESATVAPTKVAGKAHKPAFGHKLLLK